MRKLFLLIVLCPILVLAQVDDEALTWEDFLERVADETDEAEGLDAELMEQLEQLHAAPIDINSATAEDLLQLPFINTTKAADIIAYRQRHGALFTLGELMLIPSLTKDEREKLRLFVCVDEGKAKDYSRSQRSSRNIIGHDAVMRCDIPFYTKAGYTKYPDSVISKSPNKTYRGNRYYNSLRYAVTYGKHYAAGIQAEKDAGERGIDFLSAYAMVNDVGILHRAIVGNYRVSFGKGLAVGSGSKLGKMMMLGNTSRIDAGIARHSSMAEDGYMTGAATTLKWNKLLLTAFASRRKADGTMRNDVVGVSSLKTDGLHRTTLEHSKRGNLTIRNIGGNIHYGDHNAAISATFIATHLSTPLAPTHDTPSTLYRLYNAQGTDFMNASIAYMRHFARLSVSGEAAFSNAQGFANPATNTREGNQHGCATLHTLQWRINDTHTLMTIARWYCTRYVSLNGKAFGENAMVQNEEGVLLGWTAQMDNSLKLTAYADLMRFPWMKHQTSNTSHGIEGLLQAEYTPRRNLSMTLRYRIKAKERDFGDVLRYRTTHNARLQINSKVSSCLSMRTLAVGTMMSFAGSINRGFSIGESLRWQRDGGKTKVDVGVAYFNTDSYDTRITVYEPSLPYAFGALTYAYHGLRTNILATVPLHNQNLSITAKLGGTYYFNRDHISSGLELIDANHREDLQLQLRWKM